MERCKRRMRVAHFEADESRLVIEAVNYFLAETDPEDIQRVGDVEWVAKAENDEGDVYGDYSCTIVAYECVAQ